MTTQLVFNGTVLPIINQNNQIWLSSKELVKALGYADSKAVTRIYNENKDEFTGSMTMIIESNISDFIEGVDLTTSKKARNLKTSTRIFSLRGCHLIAMFSRTKLAKEFRKWVLDVLDKEVTKYQAQSLMVNKEQQQVIKSSVNERHHRTGEHWQLIYTKLYEQFKVPSYKDLPANKFEAVMLWINDGGDYRKPYVDFNLDYFLAHAKALVNETEQYLKTLKLTENRLKAMKGAMRYLTKADFILGK